MSGAEGNLDPVHGAYAGFEPEPFERGHIAQTWNIKAGLRDGLVGREVAAGLDFAGRGGRREVLALEEASECQDLGSALARDARG